MKKFKFRLERILQYRQLVKEEKRKELLKINLRLRDEQDHLEYLSSELANNKVDDGAVMDVGAFTMAGMYSMRLRSEIERQHQRIADTEKEVAAALEVYVEAAKEAKALETLRARRLVQYNEYVAKEEDKFLDELTTQRFVRSKRHEESI